MPLTMEHQQLIVDTLNERLKPRNLLCPVSGDMQWTVSSQVVMLPVSDSVQESLLAGKAALPLAVVECRTCGYTFFVNLITLGLGDALDIQEIKDG